MHNFLPIQLNLPCVRNDAREEGQWTINRPDPLDDVGTGCDIDLEGRMRGQPCSVDLKVQLPQQSFDIIDTA